MVLVDGLRGAFQYPLVDRVGFEGDLDSTNYVSSGPFQYPLVDRVGFEGKSAAIMEIMNNASFSILWWIELVLRGASRLSAMSVSACFSILWWIELVLRAAWR